MRRLESPNQDGRPEGTPIDTIVLHYTGMRDAAAAIGRLCDPVAAVSAHYVIEEDGAVWQLVAEGRRAFHAGVSFWRGQSGLNGRSVGVEIVNPGHEFGYRPFPAAQMEAVAELCRRIQGRHPIDPRNVVGHSDIAPNRKQDPGELFDWRWLAGQGVGLWTDAEAAPRQTMEALLAGIGYDVTLTEATGAFQRRFRPGGVDGVADAQTWGRAQAVHDVMVGVGRV